MDSIPIGALGFGAESISNHPIAYGKSRVAGSAWMSYLLHSKAGCMPGQPALFKISPTTHPGLGAPIDNNPVIRAFTKKHISLLAFPIGSKFTKDAQDAYTFEEYYPHDDETLEVAIKASYRQVFGNLHAMESEKPRELERRLRNGDLSIREFIRQLAKSSFYRTHFVEAVNQQRLIELNFKHLLGRPPFDQNEIIHHIELLHNEGYESHIDTIIDSNEYEEIFGSYIVPYQRCWNSPCGIKTNSFINTTTLVRSFATSDNAIHCRKASPEEGGGKSQLVNSLARNNPEKIRIPCHVSFVGSTPL